MKKKTFTTMQYQIIMVLRDVSPHMVFFGPWAKAAKRMLKNGWLRVRKDKPVYDNSEHCDFCNGNSKGRRYITTPSGKRIFNRGTITTKKL